MLEQLLRRCWGPPEGGPQREGSDTNRKLHSVASVLLSCNHANLEPRPLHSAFISGARRDTPFLSNSCTRSTKYQRISYSKIFPSLVGEPFQYKLTSRTKKNQNIPTDDTMASRMHQFPSSVPVSCTSYRRCRGILTGAREEIR